MRRRRSSAAAARRRGVVPAPPSAPFPFPTEGSEGGGSSAAAGCWWAGAAARNPSEGVRERRGEAEEAQHSQSPRGCEDGQQPTNVVPTRGRESSRQAAAPAALIVVDFCSSRSSTRQRGGRLPVQEGVVKMTLRILLLASLAGLAASAPTSCYQGRRGQQIPYPVAPSATPGNMVCARFCFLCATNPGACSCSTHHAGAASSASRISK